MQNISSILVTAEPLTGDHIIAGEFLDVIGTNYYKAQQLKELCALIYDGSIQDDDVILFMDYWFPGIEMLQYIRDGMGKKF